MPFLFSKSLRELTMLLIFSELQQWDAPIEGGGGWQNGTQPGPLALKVFIKLKVKLRISVSYCDLSNKCKVR